MVMTPTKKKASTADEAEVIGSHGVPPAHDQSRRSQSERFRRDRYAELGTTFDTSARATPAPAPAVPDAFAELLNTNLVDV
ncbi:hypothetical protein Q5752_003372 [Cryptotrichosporon argae]